MTFGYYDPPLVSRLWLQTSSGVHVLIPFLALSAKKVSGNLRTPPAHARASSP